MRNQYLIPLLIGLCIGFMGCDDDSPAAEPVTPDAAVDDAAVSDAAPVVDQGPEPDAALPDMAIVDAAPIDVAMPNAMPEPLEDPIIVADVACDADDECADFERCLGNLCRIDLKPEVFVVSTVMVQEPEFSRGLLQGLLTGIISSNSLNLIVEPGGYQEGGDYRWYVGNGGYADGSYDYLGVYPVQNFDGFWRRAPNGLPYWGMEGNTPFVLYVPAGTAMTAEGDQVRCYTRFSVTVDLRLQPALSADGVPEMNMTLKGYLAESDAARVSFSQGGAENTLVSLLDPSDLNLDTDGDGEPDAYPFDFSGAAAAVNFIGDPPLADGSNRDPMPNFQNPPECD